MSFQQENKAITYFFHVLGANNDEISPTNNSCPPVFLPANITWLSFNKNKTMGYL